MRIYDRRGEQKICNIRRSQQALPPVGFLPIYATGRRGTITSPAIKLLFHRRQFAFNFQFAFRPRKEDEPKNKMKQKKKKKVKEGASL